MTVESQVHAAVAALIAPSALITLVHRFRSSPLPFPAALTLETDDRTLTCVVKASADPGRLNREAHILRALEDLGFPAPRVMAGPCVVATSTGAIEVLVLSLMAGQALPWIDVTDVAGADRTSRTLFDAVDRLHALTSRIAVHPAATDIPTQSLDDELAAVSIRTSPWAETRVVREALDILHDQVPRYRQALVFSNGDYNPLNVLANDAGFIGWVDFELGCFEDPLIGFPKFLFWSDDRGWSLARKVGLVERFLYRRQVTPAAFMVRVALRGLTHLHDAALDDPPTRVLGEIELAIKTLRRDA